VAWTADPAAMATAAAPSATVSNSPPINTTATPARHERWRVARPAVKRHSQRNQPRGLQGTLVPCPSLCAGFHQPTGRVPPPIPGQPAPPSPVPATSRCALRQPTQDDLGVATQTATVLPQPRESAADPVERQGLIGVAAPQSRTAPPHSPRFLARMRHRHHQNWQFGATRLRQILCREVAHTRSHYVEGESQCSAAYLLSPC
jgi:hypothetical protein